MRSEAETTLDAYRAAKLVVLNPSSSADEAARAMHQHHVGAVLLADRHGLAGIVTDRDLALGVTAAGDDPAVTPLWEVMSDKVRTVGTDATVADVARVMRENAVRRVPIVDGRQIVGMVTLDDLILDRRIDLAEASSVIRAQLERAPGDRPAALARSRHASRAEATFRAWTDAVATASGLSVRRAELALKIVVTGLCRALDPKTVQKLTAQLPTLLREDVQHHHQRRADHALRRAHIEAQLESALGLAETGATAVLKAVALLLVERVSAGELEHLRGHLPEELSELLRAAPAKETSPVARPASP